MNCRFVQLDVKRHVEIRPTRQKTSDVVIGRRMKGKTLCQKSTLD